MGNIPLGRLSSNAALHDQRSLLERQDSRVARMRGLRGRAEVRISEFSGIFCFFALRWVVGGNGPFRSSLGNVFGHRTPSAAFCARYLERRSDGVHVTRVLPLAGLIEQFGISSAERRIFPHGGLDHGS